MDGLGIYLYVSYWPDYKYDSKIAIYVNDLFCPSSLQYSNLHKLLKKYINIKRI